MRPVIALALAACSSQGPGSFDPPFEQTSMELAITSGGVATGGFSFGVDGTRDVGGETMPVVRVVDPRAGELAAVEIAISIERDTLTFGALQVPDTDAGLGVDLILGSPVTFELDGPLGEAQTQTVEGAITFGDPAFVDPGYLPFDLTLTPEEEGVVAPAPLGDIPGCRRATFSASSSGVGVDGQLWTHEDIGVVYGEVDAAPFGTFTLGAEGWTGWADSGGRRLIQKEAVLDALHPSFSLSTAEVDGDFLADKNTHAQMWLEVRWADDDRARTEERPPVTQSFGTVWGSFPSELVRVDASVLHPDDADQGFVYWVAAVDEAARNESENGISYGVGATHDGGDAVHAAAFIRYRRLE